MQKLKQWLRLARGFFPSKLPTGSTDLEAFIASVISTYNLPDNDTFKSAVCTMILHLAPDVNYMAKRHFAKAILKSMANQVAYDAMQTYKEKAKAKLEVVGGTEADSATKEMVREAETRRVQ